MNIKIDLNLNAPELVEAIKNLKEEIAANKEEKSKLPKTKEEQESSSISKETNATLETVRAKLAKLAQSGKQEQVKALIQKYGGSRLSEIDPEHYEQLLKDAEAI